MVQASMLTEIVQRFVAATPDIQGAALVTPDGLSLTSVLPTNMDEERTAAMSAAMLSLGERIGQELARGVVERILVEGEKGYSIMVGCGNEAVFLVLASKEAKQGLLFLQIKRTVQELAPMLN
ncbi:MAG: roadblock/LC7 domain-containing protein [Xenococcaceae cyanobacterium MO_167.B27]|nr:roadblock/LC7 domain-containing protein [Xenococcaceae cyanobacterium MO_167.B27]